VLELAVGGLEEHDQRAGGGVRGVVTGLVQVGVGVQEHHDQPPVADDPLGGGHIEVDAGRRVHRRGPHVAGDRTVEDARRPGRPSGQHEQAEHGGAERRLQPRHARPPAR
jgi:hypothetical protein